MHAPHGRKAHKSLDRWAVLGYCAAFGGTIAAPRTDTSPHDHAPFRSPRRTRVRHLDRGSASGHRARIGRCRPSGIGANRVGENRGVWLGHRRNAAAGRTAFGRTRRPLGADRGTHARIGAAGAPRNRMAVCPHRGARDIVHRGHGRPRGTPRAGTRRPYRCGHPGPPARPY